MIMRTGFGVFLPQLHQVRPHTTDIHHLDLAEEVVGEGL